MNEAPYGKCGNCGAALPPPAAAAHSVCVVIYPGTNAGGAGFVLPNVKVGPLV